MGPYTLTGATAVALAPAMATGGRTMTSKEHPDPKGSVRGIGLLWFGDKKRRRQADVLPGSLKNDNFTETLSADFDDGYKSWTVGFFSSRLEQHLRRLTLVGGETRWPKKL